METVKVLDHGYVKFIESWGSDERIIEAARMSTNKGFKGWGRPATYVCRKCDYMVEPWWKDRAELVETPLQECDCSHGGRCDFTLMTFPAGDEKLLKYLYEHHHDTPFEMAGLVIEVQAPIMVFREWHRHRTQSYNEMSARYTPLPDFNYIPSVDRCLVVNSTNKQAGKITDADELTHESVLEWLASLGGVYAHAEVVYQDGLRRGIPKELARLPVPVGRYSRMRASANLRNWLGFATLRSDRNPHAQWEIQRYANVVVDIIAERFPRTAELYLAGNR